MRKISLLLVASFLIGCGGGGGGGGGTTNTTPPPIAAATIKGTVSGTVVVAVDQNDTEVARNTANGTPKTFTLYVPVGRQYRFYLVEGDSTSAMKIYPLYWGATNVFIIDNVVTIDLGMVTVDVTGKAIPEKNPFGQGCTNGGEYVSQPANFELAGTWRAHTVAAGPGAPWWSRGTIQIGSDGTFTGTVDEYGGTSSHPAGKFSIAIDRIVSLAGDPNFGGHLDSGGTVFVGTDTWTGSKSGTTEMFIAVKKSSSYSSTDLAGTWEANAIVTGTSRGWSRGTLTIGPNGTYSGTLVDSGGVPEILAGTLAISADGIITDSSNSTFQGDMDSGKTVVIATKTTPDISSELIVLARKAPSYSQSDLAGIWEGSRLSSSAIDNGWSRGTFSIGSGGSISGFFTTSGGSSVTNSGTLVLSADGVVTNPSDNMLRGCMNAGKTIFVTTSTTSGNVPQLRVYTKNKYSVGGTGGIGGIRVTVIPGSLATALVYGGGVPASNAEASQIAESPEAHGYTFLGTLSSTQRFYYGSNTYILIKVRTTIHTDDPALNIDSIQRMEDGMYMTGGTFVINGEILGFYGSGAFDSDKQSGVGAYLYGPPDGKYVAVYGWTLFPVIRWAPVPPGLLTP